MNNFKAALFDFDGTLVDSLSAWKKLDEQFFHSRGVEYSPDKVQFGGMSFSESAEYIKEILNLPEDVEQIKSEWIDLSFALYRDSVKPKPFAFETALAFKNCGCKIAIGSSNNEQILMPYLDNFGMAEEFDLILTCCEAGKGKPNPDVYLTIAESLKLNSRDCVVFEDTYEGVLAGKNASMKVIAVGDEAHKAHKNDIINAADFYIEDMSYFEKHLSDIKAFVESIL